MKKEIAEKWVAALRSGRYEQTTERLKRADGFCCLGVLCDIVRYDVNGHWGYGYGSLSFIVKDEDNDIINESAIDTLPIAVVQFADLNSNDPETISGVVLTELNDGDNLRTIKPHSFEEIANIIEKEWETL